MLLIEKIRSYSCSTSKTTPRNDFSEKSEGGVKRESTADYFQLAAKLPNFSLDTDKSIGS